MRFTNLDQFEKTLDRIAKEVHSSADVILRKIGFQVFAGVTKRTPVDTGYARANWLISTNTVDTTVLSKGDFPAGSKNLAAAKSINKEMRASVRPDKGRTSLFITNSVPYAIYLEQGWSKQMDKGYMVQRTLADVTANLEAELDADE